MKEKPFKTTTAAWFWFMERTESGGLAPEFRDRSRPCEPMEIIRILDRMKKDGALTMDHILILRKYGRFGRLPDPTKPEQKRAWKLWHEAIFELNKELVKQGIVEDGGRV